MTAINRIFVAAIAFIVCLGAALGLFLYVSLIPYFHPIGLAMAALVAIGIGCTALLLITFTISRIGIMISQQRRAAIHSRVIVAGNVVALPQSDGTLIHLSAMHEAAKIPMITAGKPRQEEEEEEEQQLSPDDVVVELWEKGLSLRTIEKATGRKYHEIQKITSEEKKRRSLL